MNPEQNIKGGFSCSKCGEFTDNDTFICDGCAGEAVKIFEKAMADMATMPKFKHLKRAMKRGMWKRACQYEGKYYVCNGIAIYHTDIFALHRLGLIDASGKIIRHFLKQEIDTFIKNIPEKEKRIALKRTDIALSGKSCYTAIFFIGEGLFVPIDKNFLRPVTHCKDIFTTGEKQPVYFMDGEQVVAVIGPVRLLPYYTNADMWAEIAKVAKPAL